MCYSVQIKKMLLERTSRDRECGVEVGVDGGVTEGFDK